MGRGDKKTKKGKRFAGSYGRVRVRKTDTEKFVEKVQETKDKIKTTPKKKTTTKKKTSKKEE
ncbi:MAG: 30S ribosomal protein THX [Flavobacteriales bacterium]|nr:30S ribosomal protein THX [Flavobacteriales bacterium]|tara:strand:- start:611 stop:796 length:186 start_codon:yes stop_codon:yes gene_type:complete